MYKTRQSHILNIGGNNSFWKRTSNWKYWFLVWYCYYTKRLISFEFQITCARSCQLFRSDMILYSYCDRQTGLLPFYPELFPSNRFFSDNFFSPSSYFPIHWKVHTLQTTHQEEKKSQHTTKKRTQRRDEKNSQPSTKIIPQPSEERGPIQSDEKKSHPSEGPKSHPGEKTSHTTQHKETDKDRRTGSLLSSEAEERKKEKDKLKEVSTSDSSPEQSAQSSRKSSLSESSSRELNEVDLVDGKERIVSHFAKHLFFKLHSHEPHAPLWSATCRL